MHFQLFHHHIQFNTLILQLSQFFLFGIEHFIGLGLGRTTCTAAPTFLFFFITATPTVVVLLHLLLFEIFPYNLVLGYFLEHADPFEYICDIVDTPLLDIQPISCFIQVHASSCNGRLLGLYVVKQVKRESDDQ